MQGGREEINQGNCRDPNDPSRDEQGDRALEERLSPESDAKGGERPLFFGIEIAEDGLRETEEWAPDKLVDESFFGDGGGIRAVPKEVGLGAVEKVDFPALNGPSEGENRDLDSWKGNTVRGEKALDHRGDQGSEECGGEDCEPGGPGHFPFADLIKETGERREFVVSQNEDHSHDPQGDRRNKISSGSAPAEARRFLKVVSHGLAIPRCHQKCEPFDIECIPRWRESPS